jgi:hypothetical protein
MGEIKSIWVVIFFDYSSENGISKIYCVNKPFESMIKIYFLSISS